MHNFKIVRCCSNSKVVDITTNRKVVGFRGKESSKYNLAREEIRCLEDGDNILEGMEECNDGSYHEFILGSKLYNISQNGASITISNNCDLTAPEVTIEQSMNNFCVSYI